MPCFFYSGFAELQIVKTVTVSPGWQNYDCHSPTIIELEQEHLLVAWFGGFGEGKCDYPQFANQVGIWLSRYENGRWSLPNLVALHEKTRCWNPVFHRLANGELILFYKVGDSPRAWFGVFKRSIDEGRTWSEEELLPAGILGPIKNKPLCAEEGSLICGSSVESGDSENPFQATACWIEIASPQLDKWEKFGPLEIPGRRFGALQPSLYMDDRGDLHLFCRDRANRIAEKGFIWHAVSQDAGKHWSELANTGLPNPDSGIDTLKLSRNQVLLIYNSSHENRFPLTLALSNDDGKSWNQFWEIDSEQSEYPYLISSEDRGIYLVYSHLRPCGKQREIKWISMRIN